ncbi:MAG: GMC family oxidoreductase [Steroidobacteraceae bacterium]
MDLAALYAAHAPPTLGPHYDAIVIGSGPGGSAVAHRLAHAGRKVLVVERGELFAPTTPAAPGVVGHYLYDLIAMGESPARFVGGQSKFFGAAMYRMRASDFLATQHEAGISPAWPFDYAALEPYYCAAERLYRVHGDPAGDPTEPPRSQPLPFGPLPHSAVVAPCVQRLQAAGHVVSAIPRGVDYGPQGRCTLCSTCDAYACSLDAKMDAESATLRPALLTGNVELALQSECLRIVTDASGSRAIGAMIRRHGTNQLIEAGRIVVAAGLPGSMQLLWQSRTARHPAGLGNAHGNLGRYLGGHWTGMIFPLLSWRAQPANHTKTFSINNHYDGMPDWPWPLGVIQVAGQMPYWRFSSRLMRLPARLLAQRSLLCFYMIEAVPGADSGHVVTAEGIAAKTEPRLSKRTFDSARQRAAATFRSAGYRVIARNNPPTLWHQVGTARMGEDPRTSVCNADCAVHDIPNLHVVDASVLPSAGAVNTCLTIVAVALKAADAMLTPRPQKPGPR